jgi:flavorubredoxin
MHTDIAEVADRVYRVSTYVEPANLVFNQYLIKAGQPLLFHCGLRALFPSVSQAVAAVLPLHSLKWISFGHYEADECGSMNDWLAVAPEATIVFGRTGCMVSVNDMAARPPHPVNDGATIDLGDHQLRYIATPHVPHGWDAGLLFDQQTQTLFCGDLFTAVGRHPTSTDADIVGPAMKAEDAYRATALTPDTAPTIRKLSELNPRTLCLMHGPAFTGNCAGALKGLADAYEKRFRAQTE